MTALIIKSWLVLALAVSYAMPQEPVPTHIAPEIIVPEIIEVKDEIPEQLKKIAQCESGGKHFDKNGKVIRGKENPNDIGKWQINLFYHLETANKLGYDIFTEEGNEGYALWLYKKNGTRDWLYSQACWKNT